MPESSFPSFGLSFGLTFGKIDHIAIAVRNIEAAVELYTYCFGFTLEKRRQIKGRYSGMNSAELNAGQFSIVLVEATEPESQIARYINDYGPGVQHIAIEVENIQETEVRLREKGISFATSIIKGDSLLQLFTKRDPNTGMMFEFIERKSTTGFEAGNIQELFHQLEESNAY